MKKAHDPKNQSDQIQKKEGGPDAVLKIPNFDLVYNVDKEEDKKGPSHITVKEGDMDVRE